MVRGFATLLAFQLFGEALTFWSGSRVPGPVIGLVLLAVSLVFVWRGWMSAGVAVSEDVEKTANGLIVNLGLFFVPAGVGIVQHLDLLAAEGTRLAIVLLSTTLLTLIVCVWTFVLVDRLVQRYRGGAQ